MAVLYLLFVYYGHDNLCTKTIIIIRFKRCVLSHYISLKQLAETALQRVVPTGAKTSKAVKIFFGRRGGSDT